MLEHLSEGPLKGAHKARGLHVDLLRLAHLLVEIFHLHDVKLGDEGVNDLALLVYCAGVLELSTQMELTLDLELVLKNAVDPLLEHVGSHGVVELVAERLVLEIEFNSCLPSGHLDQGKENLNRPFWDGLQWVWLAEFHLIAIRQEMRA